MKAHKIAFISPEERLKQIKERSYTERFEILMRLIRISRMVANAKLSPENK
jgi:hypothetical protein